MSSEEEGKRGERPPESPHEEAFEPLDPAHPLAVLVIGGEHDLGCRSFQVFLEKYREPYHQVLFLSIGVTPFTIPASGVDALPRRKKAEALSLKKEVQMSLDPYVASAHELRMRAAMRVTVGNDPVEELASMAAIIAKEYPKAVFFISKLVFKSRRWFHPFLYGGTANKIQEVLHAEGLPVITIPVLV